MTEILKREGVGTIEGTGDGRTLDLRVVPYGVPTQVSDNGRDIYTEQWEPGCFERQEGAPNRVDVLMNFEHERGIGGVIGRGTELRDLPSGLEGTFRMLSAADADKALELVNEGVLTGVSLEAQPLKTVHENGIVKRVKARLVNVALCRSPAYTDAQVLAVREAPDDENLPEMPAEPPRQPEDGEFGDSGTQFVSIEPAGESSEAERSQEVDALLERVGYAPLLTRVVTKKPWDGSPARFDDAQYAKSCLIDRGGDAPAKDRCSLPVLEPNGDINANALGAAAAALSGSRGGVKASGEQKAKAARKLMRYYRQAAMDPPPMLKMMAAK